MLGTMIKNPVPFLIVAGAKAPVPEVGSQRSEVGQRAPEVGSQKSELSLSAKGSAEAEGQRSEV
jgi:hypothetical protein